MPFRSTPYIQTNLRIPHAPHDLSSPRCPVHQPQRIPLAHEPQHVHHEVVQFVHDVRWKKVAVHFHREDRVVALPRSGREEALDDVLSALSFGHHGQLL